MFSAIARFSWSFLLALMFLGVPASAEALKLDLGASLLELNLGCGVDPRWQEAPPEPAEADSPATPAAGRPYATQGSVAWWMEVGGGTNFDHGWVALGGVGVEWYPVDGFALGVRADGVGIGLEGTPATAGGGASILLRWHVLRREEWSIYIEGGCGLAYFARAVPTGGSHLNFTPEAGVGLTISISDRMRLLGGVRWYHISNAQTASRNPGVDMLTGYLGITVGF